MSFNKNGIVSAQNISNFIPTYEMLTKQLNDGSVWSRIYWLDTTTCKNAFTNNDEVLECTNRPNRFSRMGFVDKFKSYKLPLEYTKLDYIESNGTQFINTNYYWTSETVKVYMDACVTSNNSYQSLFGNEEKRSDGGDRYFGIIPHGINGTFALYTGTSGVLSIATGINNRFTLECETDGNKKLTAKLNGSQAGSATYSGTIMTYPNTSSTHKSKGLVYIFSNHNSSSGDDAIQNIGGMRLYNFKMYDNGGIVRDFVPVMKKNGEIGLFDQIYRVFYPNAGSGTFLAGPISQTQLAETGLYEFMLTYPNLSLTQYNRWTQTISPNSEYVTSITGTGYNTIHNDFSLHQAPITKSASNDSSLYSCNLAGNWWAPIGQKKLYSDGIPAADGSVRLSTELWIRIDLLAELDMLNIYKNNVISSLNFIEF